MVRKEQGGDQEKANKRLRARSRLGRPRQCEAPSFNVSHTLIDQQVWQDIVDYFSNPDWLERILARERAREAAEAEDKNKRLVDLEKALAAKKASADQLVQLAANITSAKMREKLQKQMNELGAELEVLEQERARLLVPPMTELELQTQRQAFQAWAKDFMIGASQGYAHLEEKRQVLYWLGVEVRVWREARQLDYELRLSWRGFNAGRPLLLRQRNAALSVLT